MNLRAICPNNNLRAPFRDIPWRPGGVVICASGGGAEGQRVGGSEGRRVGGAEGRRGGGAEGRRGGGTEGRRVRGPEGRRGGGAELGGLVVSLDKKLCLILPLNYSPRGVNRHRRQSASRLLGETVRWTSILSSGE